MDHPDLTESHFMEISLVLKGVHVINEQYVAVLWSSAWLEIGVLQVRA